MKIFFKYSVESGFKFDVKKDEYDDVNEIVMLPSFQKFSIGKQKIFYMKLKRSGYRSVVYDF